MSIYPNQSSYETIKRRECVRHDRDERRKDVNKITIAAPGA